MQDLEQKIWELETRIKSLEGGGLSELVADFNSRIDGITKIAIDKLDSIRVDYMKLNRPLYASSNGRYELEERARRSEAARQLEAGFYNLGMAQGLGQSLASYGAGLIGSSILCK